jgi:hypothetical protein
MPTSRDVRPRLSIAEANRSYFWTLANTRASLGMIATLGVPIIILLGGMNFGTLDRAAFEGYGVIRAVFIVNLVLVGMCALVVIASLFKKLIYQFQVFFSFVSVGIAVVLVYCLCLSGLVLATVFKAGNTSEAMMWFGIGGVATVVLVAGAITVHSLLLRHRLRVGHSEKRTMGNFVAVSGSNRAKIMWITLALVAVIPNVLTRGQYLTNTLGVCGLILFACLTTSLPVEFAYLAYLKSKDRSYWEERPRGMPKAERRRLTRKVILWAVGIVVAVVLFWVFAKYGHS